MARRSAGLLLFRTSDETLEVLLVHPGGPLWAKKDAGAWSIPKGEIGESEDPLETARREFAEETGQKVDGPVIELGEIRQKGGKTVQAWALKGDLDPATIRSNTFTMQWPPRSGRMREFAEVDRAQWFTLEKAREKINPAQVAFLKRLKAETSRP
jgi:predicted NUDIX family NTP pyrophosphohydrolase